MEYILSGDPKEVQKVLKENRIRADRGLIKFTPYQPETAEEQSKVPESGDNYGVDTKDSPGIIDSKEAPDVVDTKTPKSPKRTKKPE